MGFFENVERVEAEIAARFSGTGSEACSVCTYRAWRGLPVAEVATAEYWYCAGWKANAEKVCGPCLLKLCFEYDEDPASYGMDEAAQQKAGRTEELQQ